MKIKLSDFILENSIDTDATVDDIQFEQTVAQLDVAFTMLEYYMKQLQMGADFFQEVEAEPPKDMPTKDQLIPNTSQVQSYDEDSNTDAVRQALKDIGCDVSNNLRDDGGVTGYFDVQVYDGSTDTYAITYYPATSSVEVTLISGYSHKNPYSSYEGVDTRFKISKNKNVKTQLQKIANNVDKNLKKFYNSRPDLADYKKDPNNKFYSGYHKDTDVNLNTGKTITMKDVALNYLSIGGLLTTLVGLCTALIQLMATLERLLYSILSDLKRLTGMKSRTAADSNMVSNLKIGMFNSHLMKDVFNNVDRTLFLRKVISTIDKMYYTLQAMNILTKKSDMNAADSFQRMVSEYQQMIQRAISKAQTNDVTVKSEADADWLSSLEKILESDRAKAVQSMIHNISEQQFKRQLEQGLQGIDQTSMRIILTDTKKLQAGIQRDLIESRKTFAQLNSQLNKAFAQQKAALTTTPMTQPQQQPQQQTPPPQQQGGQVMQMQ